MTEDYPTFRAGYPGIAGHRQAQAMAANHIRTELAEFDERARQAELLIRLAVSAALLTMGYSAKDARALSEARIADLLDDAIGAKRAEILRRLDDEGGL